MTYTGGGSIHLGLSSVREWVRRYAPHTVADFGVGRGSMGRLIRQEAPDAHFLGCDTWEPVVRRHQTGRLYNEVVLAPIPEFARVAPVGPGVLWVFGDVLEHLPPVDALRGIKGNPEGCVLVRVPVGRWPQADVGGNVNETHLWDVYPETLAVRPVLHVRVANRRTKVVYLDMHNRPEYAATRETWYANVFFGPVAT